MAVVLIDPVRRAQLQAQAYARNNARLQNLIARAAEKAGANKQYVAGCFEDLCTVLRMLRAWASGRYRKVPYRTILAAIGCVVYFVNPFDVLPDLVLPLGLSDDMFVISSALGAIAKDINEFRLWEKQETGGQGAE